MRRNEQISPEAVSVLKFPLKMSKAGKILRENYNEDLRIWFTTRVKFTTGITVTTRIKFTTRIDVKTRNRMKIRIRTRIWVKTQD